MQISVVSVECHIFKTILSIIHLVTSRLLQLRRVCAFLHCEHAPYQRLGIPVIQAATVPSSRSSGGNPPTRSDETLAAWSEQKQGIHKQLTHPSVA